MISNYFIKIKKEKCLYLCLNILAYSIRKLIRLKAVIHDFKATGAPRSIRSHHHAVRFNWPNSATQVTITSIYWHWPTNAPKLRTTNQTRPMIAEPANSIDAPFPLQKSIKIIHVSSD